MEPIPNQQGTKPGQRANRRPLVSLRKKTAVPGFGSGPYASRDLNTPKSVHVHFILCFFEAVF